MGKKIGKGECWDLAEQALKNAGAKTSNDLGPVEDDTDYIWGQEIADVKDVEPGYILQIRDHVVAITTVTEYTFSDGSGGIDTVPSPMSLTRPHHTAIADGKLDADGAIKTLEQNVDPAGKVLQNKKIYTRDIPPVTTKSYVTKFNPNTKKMEKAEVTTTVTVKVTGKIWVYKPISK
jgi:hypothetical protein